MNEGQEPTSLSPERLDRALLAAFDLDVGEPAPSHDSVVSALERITGANPRIQLRLASRDPDSQPRKPAATFGRYQLLGELAQGGLGVVLKARDVDLGRQVAIKMLHRRHRGNVALTQRLLAEAQIGGQLQHPGIVPVYEMGLHTDRQPYFTMKLVEGETLAEILHRRSSPQADRAHLLGVFAQVCHAVAYAHARGVVHRDLKPSNVMVGAFGEVQVVDWGLAKVLGVNAAGDAEVQAAEPTHASSMAGTPAYMAPEQARGEGAQIDERSDVFGLGAILCEILTGQPPYVADCPEALHALARGARLEAGLARLSVSGAHAEILALTRRCLAPIPDHRPRDGSAVARGVQQYLAAMAARADVERARRIRTTYAALATLGVVMVAILAWVVVCRELDRRAARARQAVAAALNRATLYWGEARATPEAGPEAWQSAVAAAAEAVSLAIAGELDTDTQARTTRTADEIRAAAEVAHEAARVHAAEDAAVVRLEEIRASRSDHGPADRVATRRECQEVFAGLGIDLDPDRVEAAAHHIRASRIAAALIAGLDDQVRTLSGVTSTDDSSWRLLARVADLADSDATRRRLRTAWTAHDLNALRALAQAPDVAQWPPASVSLLAHGLRDCGDLHAAVAVLRAAHRTHPGDFWICHDLAQCLGGLDPVGQWQERLRFTTAAQALRPRSDHIWMDLGTLHEERGEMSDASACYLQAVHLRPDSVLAQVRLGKALLATRDFAGAASGARAAVRLMPHSTECQLLLAQALLGLGDLDGALSAARNAVESGNQADESQAMLSLVLRMRGDWDGALAALRQALAHGPQCAKLWSDLGELLEFAGAPDAGLLAHIRALALDPTAATVHHRLGASLARRGELDAALHEFEAALRLTPSRPATRCFADAVTAGGDLEAAIAAYGAALDLDPDLGDMHFALGDTLRKRGDLTSAQHMLERAVRLAPDLAAAHNHLGLVHMARRDFAAAEACFRRAVALDHRPGSLSNLALAMDRAGRPADQTLPLLDEALRQSPDHAEALTSKGQLLRSLGRFDEAIALLQRAMALRPQEPAIHNALGNALRDRGEFDAARQEFLTTIRLAPKDPVPYSNLGQLFLAQGDTTKAMVAMRKVIELDPDNGPAHRSLGAMLYHTGRVPEALPLLRRAAELSPNDAETIFTLGVALEALLRHGEALPLYRRALALGWREAEAVVGECERHADLERRLPAILRGEDRPRDTGEGVLLAYLCQAQGQLPEAAEFFAQALEGDPRPSIDALNHPFFRGALAVVGLGFGAPETGRVATDRDAPRWRERARAWLATEIATAERLLATAPALERRHLIRFLETLHRAPGLTVMRDPSWTRDLPAAEREALASLWQSLEALRARADR